jgi:hypothetical protein
VIWPTCTGTRPSGAAGGAATRSAGPTCSPPNASGPRARSSAPASGSPWPCPSAHPTATRTSATCRRPRGTSSARHVVCDESHYAGGAVRPGRGGMKNVEDILSPSCHGTPHGRPGPRLRGGAALQRLPRRADPAAPRARRHSRPSPGTSSSGGPCSSTSPAPAASPPCRRTPAGPRTALGVVAGASTGPWPRSPTREQEVVIEQLHRVRHPRLARRGVGRPSAPHRQRQVAGLVDAGTASVLACQAAIR